MKAKKLKLGDEVYFPKDNIGSKFTEHIGTLVYIDDQTLPSLKYGFDFGEGFQGGHLKVDNERFSIPNPIGIWLTKSQLKQGYRVYSGKNLKKIKPGDTVKIVNQIHKEMIGDTFIVQTGYTDNEQYASAVSQQLKLIRISKRYKYKEPSPTPKQETTDMNDQQIEYKIQAKGLNAPRVTRQDIEDNIDSEHYFTASAGMVAPLPKGSGDAELNAIPPALGLLTFCVLVLENGFTVTGESTCASLKDFDTDLEREIARQNAVNKIWPLMGYALKQRLHEEAFEG